MRTTSYVFAVLIIVAVLALTALLALADAARAGNGAAEAALPHIEAVVWTAIGAILAVSAAYMFASVWRRPEQRSDRSHARRAGLPSRLDGKEYPALRRWHGRDVTWRQ